MKKSIRALCVIGLVSALSACAMLPTWQDDEQYLVHVVLVWLKQPGNLQHRQEIIQASRALGEIPGVLDLRVGQVVPGERDVVEDSYDIGLVLRFRGKDALQAYLDHPLHVSTVKARFMPLMARYQVMDFAAP